MQLPTFGEVFLTTDDVQGGLENLKLFKGKLISSLCGGCRKLFVIEEGLDNQGIISTLHSPEHDEYDQTFSQDSNNLQSFDFKGSIKTIVTGKKHTVFLSDQGDIYSYGYGEYGALGHGGIIELSIPKKIIRISKVDTIACGEYHTLALSNGDIFAWGRGFEGQLGIRKDVETAASPMFLSYFYKNRIQLIACGAYHSLAVDQQGALYGWGEARFGQLGTGRKVSEQLPSRIDFLLEKPMNQSELRVGKFLPQETSFQVVSISGGYGHSAAVTSTGELYTWGFNQRGQLGNGDKDKKSSYYPKRLMQDISGIQLPGFSKVMCGYYTTYAIDQKGGLWSWGGGNLGHQNDKLVDLPRKIVLEDRKFTNMYANGQAAAFFASLRTISMKPNHGPSTGGTIISLIGTGFCDTGRQSARFKLGDQYTEVGCEYDSLTDSFRCTTPNFEEHLDKYPVECVVEVTLDGNVYVECEQKFLVYSSKIVISSLYPKCASIQGGTTLIININIDDLTASYMKHLNIGFQPRNKKKEDKSAMKQSTNKPLNPLDLSINDPELDKENWMCVEGFYEKGKISCTIPNVSQLQTDSLNFNVDVSINGQQFTGNPMVFRFYDIQIKELQPDNVMSEGGASVKIIGDGFFDTTNKRVIFKTLFGERLIEIMWDKQDRFYSFVAPPLSWLLGGQQPTPELLNAVKANGVTALLTLSGIEWIPIGTFYYIDPEVLRLGPFLVDEKLPEEQKKQLIHQEEQEIDHLKDLQGADLQKKKDEVQKQLETEEQEINYFFKKTGQYLSVYGENLANTESLLVQFIFNGNMAVNQKAIFKNKSKLVVQIPELELPTGIHDVGVEITFNGTSFSHSGKVFKYMAFDKSLNEQQKSKLEDEEIKKLKKTQPKKK
ncbi:unnamed protein product (macronuclear) [Paramecium tetraurelia]|uniref:IPT/TIG domain-containing protein n=1 Tax=Paramecium tetraurelia TaxID=5888 RepID=A0CPM6_PARTE|nr:uncharacterized protein GSPATT00009135001 [Paramecium tetraurelia]CAK72743.1 unnamed protein product [Paramecium tetraurelia]|eukprot:XP_001440140.1 hypothetical protein (macronuclear) [Paramecium tetraurelia strain d4-2]